MILGAVLAGGQSRRFGRDKALVEVNGVPLLAHAVQRLAGWCDRVVVVGRSQAQVAGVHAFLDDYPQPGMGPLGGIAAALHHALAVGADTVLTLPVDAWGLPDDLPAHLTPAPAHLASQPVIGMWPARATPLLVDLLARPGRHSLRAFAELVGARGVELSTEPFNINTPSDLAAVKDFSHGL